MTKTGLSLNMLGAFILGLQPQVTLWDTGTKPKMAWLNLLGWVCMFAGFLLMLAAEVKRSKGK